LVQALQSNLASKTFPGLVQALQSNLAGKTFPGFGQALQSNLALRQILLKCLYQARKGFTPPDLIEVPVPSQESVQS
jgi:hypothetical protein